MLLSATREKINRHVIHTWTPSSWNVKAKNYQEFTTSLEYTVSSRLTWVRDSTSKTEREKGKMGKGEGEKKESPNF